MDIKTFINELEKINIIPTKKQLEDLEKYKNMLILYNKKFNLTAIKTSEEIYLKHFYDSLTLIKAIDLKEKLKLLDIGTGAGFPGLVLKIMFPNLDITLLDSNNKKITFLEAVIKELQLVNIKCIYGRAEELNDSYREYFDIITSRAVSHLRIISELSLPYLKVNGLFLPMKGNISSELMESKQTFKILNSKVIDIIEFKLPIENSNRSIAIIKKISSLDTIYPRPYDKIIKKTLK